MNLARNYNFAPLARAAALENLSYDTPFVRTYTHGYGLLVEGQAQDRQDELEHFRDNY